MKRSAIIGLDANQSNSCPNSPAVAPKLAVASYHYDNQPTGWNSTKLTPANLGKHIFWRARRGRA
jgi:hypothetical protein